MQQKTRRREGACDATSSFATRDALPHRRRARCAMSTHTRNRPHIRESRGCATWWAARGGRASRHKKVEKTRTEDDADADTSFAPRAAPPIHNRAHGTRSAHTESRPLFRSTRARALAEAAAVGRRGG